MFVRKPEETAGVHVKPEELVMGHLPPRWEDGVVVESVRECLQHSRPLKRPLLALFRDIPHC